MLRKGRSGWDACVAAAAPGPSGVNVWNTTNAKKIEDGNDKIKEKRDIATTFFISLALSTFDESHTESR